MAQFVYIDETGSLGKLRKHPFLTMVAAVLDEGQVQALSRSLRQVAIEALGWIPSDFEFHGKDLWDGTHWWDGKHLSDRIAVYERVIGLLADHEIVLAHSTINRVKLHERHGGGADGNAYLLALQFLLEKIDRNLGADFKVIIADEATEHRVRAIKMVPDMQTWSVGEVSGRQLRTVIDSLHFVNSQASSGVQMADLVAFIVGHRRRRPHEGHPDAEA